MLEYQEDTSSHRGWEHKICFFWWLHASSQLALGVGTLKLQATGENFNSLWVGFQVEKDLWDVWTLQLFLSQSGPIIPFL